MKKLPTISFTICKLQKPFIDSIILMIQRPWWKNIRNDHINLKQQVWLKSVAVLQKRTRITLKRLRGCGK